jgi:acyl-CoA thioesterase FadM
MYLVEAAVLQWLRDQGTSARELYLRHGLGFEILDCSVQLPAVLELDDDVRAVVVAGTGNRLSVRLSVVRDGRDVTVLRGKVTVALVRERTAAVHRPAPTALARYETQALPAAEGRLSLRPGQRVDEVLTAAQPDAVVWSWRAPYYYCHFSDRVQHSGFVRALEQAVDVFLADRGISVGRMLAERSWIPVVSRARVWLREAAHMEETVHTTFTVTAVLRRVMFDGRLECHVQRGDVLVPVASAQILHGYAIAAGPGAGGLAELDDELVRVLCGGRS